MNEPDMSFAVIVHPLHGMGVITQEEQHQFHIKWADEDIIITDGGKPAKVFKRDVRVVTQQELAIVNALYKLDQQELADAWLKEGRPHPASTKEKAIIAQVANIMRTAQEEDREPTQEEQAKMAALRDEALALPLEDISLHTRVQRVIGEAHDKHQAHPAPLNGSIASNVVPFKPA